MSKIDNETEGSFFQLIVSILLVGIVFAGAVTSLRIGGIKHSYNNENESLDKEWHSSVVARVIDTWDDIEIFFSDDTRVVLTNDLYVNKDGKKEKVELKVGTRLYLQNQKANLDDPNNKSIITKICPTMDDVNNCQSLSLLIDSHFNGYTRNQGYIKANLPKKETP